MWDEEMLETQATPFIVDSHQMIFERRAINFTRFLLVQCEAIISVINVSQVINFYCYHFPYQEFTLP